MIAQALTAHLEQSDVLTGPEYAVQVALALALAAELDRQCATGEGVNAALVGQFQDAFGGLIEDDDANDPIGAVLTQILDAAPTRSPQ